MTEQFTQPVPPEQPDLERDKMIRHAQYLIDQGFIKGVSLDKLIKQLEESKKPKSESKPINIPQAGKMDTFGDLEDFM